MSINLLQADPSQLSQLSLTGEVLQTLHLLGGPALDSFQYVPVSLVLGGPELKIVLQVQPHLAFPSFSE